MSCLPPASYTSASSDELYPITVYIQNAYGGMTPVTALADTGNHRTIMKREVADSLGLDLSQGQPIHIGGINGEPREFRTFRLMMKIGTLPEPFAVNIGFATQHGDLVENLIGNADILKSGKIEVVYDHDSVTYRPRPGTYNIAGCSVNDNDQAYINNNYEQLMTMSNDLRRREKKEMVANFGYFY